MLLNQISQSIKAWNKLSSVTMKPLIAYKILKYVQLVNAEHAICEKQRVVLIHEITNTKDGENVKIKPNTPEFTAFIERFNETMSVESTLPQIDMNFEEVLKAIGERDNVLTVSDLATLEPFFKK